jgi:hypothetical protein
VLPGIARKKTLPTTALPDAWFLKLSRHLVNPTAMSAAQAKLISSGSFIPQREIPLTCFPLRLGRSPDADVCVEDRWVSRDHCEIRVGENGLVLSDLGSKHGTYVNGQPISHAELNSGDEISVGLSRFVVELDRDFDSAAVGQEACFAPQGTH